MLRISTLLILSSFTLSVFSNDLERTNLSDYLKELDKIDRLYQKAKGSVDDSDNSLHRFKYEVFERDLDKVKKGIQTYLDAPKRIPKSLKEDFNPIVGSY